MASPSRLGRYPVRRRLGAGAFATVWLAYDEQLDSPVAIKVLADNWTADHHVRQRFLEEGRFLRKVSSPHVVTVYDAGELEDERPFLVMSYADQGTLADRLELAPLSATQALHVICQVGQGLHALHRRGVLHRDVKPANVLFRTDHAGPGERGDDGEVCAMLGDLGLGKAMDMSSRLTMVGGTPSYVSPEQARGEGLDARSDQYSLAALAWLLLVGRPVYSHATLSAAADPAPPPPLDDEVTPEVEGVLRRALSADRDQRYADVPAFTGALAASMGGLDAHPPEAWIPLDPDLTVPGARPSAYESGPGARAATAMSPGPRRRRWTWVIAAMLALLVGLGVGYGLQEWRVTDIELDDTTGTLGVVVPEAWGASVQRDSWVPPEQDLTFPSLAAGTAGDWQDGDGEGVFVGLLPGNDLPERLPQHPECEDQRPVVTDEEDGDVSMTVHWSGCEGGLVAVERVVKVTNSQLLWVQVRAADGGTANGVLDAVSTHGM